MFTLTVIIATGNHFVADAADGALTLSFGAFVGGLDAGVVTLTYAPLEHVFGARPAAVQWVSLSYLLSLVVLLPIVRAVTRRGTLSRRTNGAIAAGQEFQVLRRHFAIARRSCNASGHVREAAAEVGGRQSSLNRPPGDLL